MITSVSRVKSILSSKEYIDIVELKNGDRAINYKRISGEIKENDRVILNITAVKLKLGTGGYHFVICNLDNTDKCKDNNSGHIMKMRYTPQQVKTLSVEEENSPYHDIIKKFTVLNKIVVILPLHSLLAPLAVVFKKIFPDAKLVYIMTEGGSLTIDLSFTVNKLCKKKYIDNTITIGQCFGGDFEAVNIFTGLAAAADVCNADLIVTGMGPGIAGTGTKLGFSGLENIFVNYAVRVLGGKGFIVPRISFSENRKRHYLISHHTITLLELIEKKANIIFPLHKSIIDVIKQLKLDKKHNIMYYNYKDIANILRNSDIEFNSMGRSYNDDPLFFISGALPVLRYKEIIEE